MGGRLAGILYLTGAVTATAMLVVPGVDTRQWKIMLTLAGVGFAWALCCFLLIPWERANPLVSHFSCSLGFPITAIAVASTGGADSPAVFYLLFMWLMRILLRLVRRSRTCRGIACTRCRVYDRTPFATASAKLIILAHYLILA